MIAYLRGTVHSVLEDQLILDVNGVGYQVFCPQSTLQSIGSTGETAALRIDTQVRDDAITLYGFADSEALIWFRRMTRIQGVGARVAISILSTFGTSDLQTIVLSQDKTQLTRTPGVGAKLAQRILTELRDYKPSVQSSDIATANISPSSSPAVESDAMSALVNLGYLPSDALRALRKVQRLSPEIDDLGELVRAGLKELAS